jgi:hypothetical protein
LRRYRRCPAWLYVHRNFDILAEPVKDGHQAIDREPFQLDLSNSRKVCFVDPCQFMSLLRRPFSGFAISGLPPSPTAVKARVISRERPQGTR